MAGSPQMMTALRNADAAGDTAAATRIAAMIKAQGPPDKGAAPPEEEDPTSIGNLAGAAVEPMMSMVSGGAGYLAGVGRTGAGMLAQNLGITSEDPFQAGQSLQEKLTYQPRTTGGQNAMTVLGAPGQVIAKAVNQIDRLGLPKEKAEALKFIVNGAASALGARAGTKVKKGAPKPADPEVRNLANQDVIMTPGQRAGKESTVGRLEQRAESLPIGGDTIRKARGRATEDWNRAQMNDAVRSAGGKPVPKDRTGRDALFHVKSELSRRYGEVLGKMKGDLNQGNGSTKQVALPGVQSAPMPGSFREALENTRKVGANLRPEERARLDHTIDKEVIGRFTSQGRANGATLKAIDEHLRLEADNFRTGGPYERQYAQAVDQIRSDFSAMIKRSNPTKLSAELDRVDQGYAKYKTAAKAMNYQKTGDVYTPAQNLRSIYARDKSKDKSKFATGQAPGQKASQEAERILGNNVPNSGTPERWAVIDALTKDPIRALASIPPSAVISLLYSRTGLKLLQHRALNPSDISELEKLGVIGAVQQPQQQQAAP